MSPISDAAAPVDISLLQCVTRAAERLTQAGVAFGHGTTNAFDEAAWLVLWRLGMPLDTPLSAVPEANNFIQNRLVTHIEQALIATLIEERISTRKPAAYLTHEAWLQGVAFYVDERAIVPRSLIAELLVEGSLDYWLSESTQRVLDLCTGNGSLAVLAAMVYPDVKVQASDISAEALEVACINIDRHGLHDRVHVRQGDGLPKTGTHYDLILCNPPYVNAQSMATLPPEFLAEPALALDGNMAGGSDGMDFVRQLLHDAPAQMSPHAVLVLEIGHERAHFEAAFPQLEVIWLETSAGEDQVLLVTREALAAHLNLPVAMPAMAAPPFTTQPVNLASDYEALRQLLLEYAAKDLADAANSSIWQDLEALPVRYGGPHGAAVLAYAGDALAGCGAVTSTAVPGVAEIKRIYVRNAFRRQGLARQLTLQLMDQARCLGYHTAAISTWPENDLALALYQSLGFVPIAPFKTHIHAQLVFLGVPLLPADLATPALTS
jgi:ribosomal protein L3 glutamine methyltransferase